MKRVCLFLFGVLAAIMLAPFDVSMLGGGVHSSPAYAATVIPLGCPGSKLQGPVSPTANYVCPNGGRIVNGSFTTDIASSGGPVCVALPIFAGSKGACKKGQVEIPNNASSGGAIIFYLKLVLKLVNSLIGGIIILVLVIAGIQYITAAGDPANIKRAKGRIINATVALVLYLMMFAILNFLVPGGVL